ncbi:MAG: hypothetical protein PHI71_16130 [Acidiphilium sp.]|nr:hypothetical protein [Acidiphilium sp.]
MSVTYETVFAGWVKKEWSQKKCAAKELARIACVSPRTAENWIAGEHAASGAVLVRLMAECRELADQINELVETQRANK